MSACINTYNIHTEKRSTVAGVDRSEYTPPECVVQSLGRVLSKLALFLTLSVSRKMGSSGFCGEVWRSALLVIACVFRLHSPHVTGQALDLALLTPSSPQLAGLLTVLHLHWQDTLHL